METVAGVSAGVARDLPEGMLQQPEPTSSSSLARPDSPQPEQAGAAQAEAPPQRIPRWLVRMELFLRVMLRMYIGLAVCYAPWSHTFWDHNPIFVQFPWLSSLAANGAVRGIISGLGLLNLWIAMRDALHHRDT